MLKGKEYTLPVVQESHIVTMNLFRIFPSASEERSIEVKEQQRFSSSEDISNRSTSQASIEKIIRQ